MPGSSKFSPERLFHLEDKSDNPAPKEVYNKRLAFAVISAAWGSGCYGYDGGFIGGTIVLPSFKTKFKLNSSVSLSTNIVSTFQGGAFFGAIFSYFINRKYGRKVALLLFGLLFEIGVILQVCSDGNVGMIYGGRALTGLAVGCFTGVVPLYISEMSTPAIRGLAVGFYEVFYQTFVLIGFWVNYGVKMNIPDTDQSQWRIPFALQLIPGSMLLICMIWQPESYRFLVRSGKIEKARKNLSYIRNLPEDHPYINWEIETAETQVAEELQFGTGIWSELVECTKSGIRGRIGLAISVMTLQNLSGINALNYYSPSIFKSIGFTGDDVGLLATGIFGVIKASTNYFAVLFVVDRFGRRLPILWCTAFTAFMMFYLAGFTAVSGSFEHKVPKDGGAYFAIVSIYLYAFFYTLSWNLIPFIYCSEIMSNKIRDIGMCISAMAQWLAQFVIVYSNPYMMKNITWGTFCFFGVWLVISIFFCYFLMPETKGISLENMDILFNAKGFARQKRREADEIIARMRAEEMANRNDLDDLKEKESREEEV